MSITERRSGIAQPELLSRIRPLHLSSLHKERSFLVPRRALQKSRTIAPESDRSMDYTAFVVRLDRVNLFQNSFLAELKQSISSQHPPRHPAVMTARFWTQPDLERRSKADPPDPKAEVQTKIVRSTGPNVRYIWPVSLCFVM